jgi:hypothetical protein
MSMRAPTDVASSSDVLNASDRRQWGVTQGRGSFSMGPYRIEDVQRHPVTQSGYSVFGFGSRKLMVGFEFAFSDGASHREGYCEQEQDKATTSYSGKLACRCGAPGTDSFNVEIGRDAKTGTLTLGGQSYRMTPLYQRQSGKSVKEPLGYRIDGERPLGAVELEGRVWTARGMEEPTRAQLVCMLAGLMLVRPVTYQRPAR